MNETRPVTCTTHLVTGADLNHHQTLYAGRCVEWCVQAAYATAASCFADARPVVFMSIRSLSMRTPARLGDLLELRGRVDYVGESTIGIRVDGRLVHPRGRSRPVVTGTFLFCTVDEHGKAVPHHLPPPAGQSESDQKRWKVAEVALTAPDA